MSDMQDPVKPVDYLRSAVMQGKPDIGYVQPLFLGGLKTQHSAILGAAQLYYALENFNAKLARGERIDQTMYNSMEVRYKEHVAEHFAEVPEEELGILLTNYFSFYQGSLNRVLLRDDLKDFIVNEDSVNVLETERGPFSLIQPAKAGSMKGLTMKDRMRKNFSKASDTPDGYSIMLMNSRVFIRIKLPTPMSLLLLINKIAAALNGFGERIRATDLELERALICREVADYVITHATYWSVSDILDARELYEVIHSKDMNALALAILCASSPKGVGYHVTCLANGCNFNEEILLDPANMVHFHDKHYPEEYMAQVRQILNRGQKFSREELRASTLPMRDIDGTEIDPILKLKNGTVSIELKDPYLADYFDCFEHAAERLNPHLRELAVQYSTKQEFKEARTNFMGSIRTIQYLQWVDKMTFHAEPGSGEEDEVFLRSTNSKEFDEGLLDCLSDEEDLAGLFLEKVIKVVPRLSYVTTGVLHNECPGCKKRAAEGIAELHGGYTPIDPILSFFGQAQMLITYRRELGIIQEGILS